MYSYDELFMRSLECYFGLYFPRCCTTREINTKITLSWAHKQFATRVHTLFYIQFTADLPPEQNGRHFTENILKRIFMNKNLCILIQISLKFVPKGPIDNKATLVQVMAWRRIGDTPLPETMLTHFTDAYMLH